VRSSAATAPPPAPPPPPDPWQEMIREKLREINEKGRRILAEKGLLPPEDAP